MRAATLIILASLSLVFARGAQVEGAGSGAGRTATLLAECVVDSRGVALSNVVRLADNSDFGGVILSDAPAVGQTMTWSREDVAARLRTVLPGVTNLVLDGAPQVVVGRRLKALSDLALLDLLREALSNEYSPLDGELGLSLLGAWASPKVPDEALQVVLVDKPINGLLGTMSLRFELRNEREQFGPWSVAVRARLMREVFVARTMLKRGQTVEPADLKTEKRDVLVWRDALTQLPPMKGLELVSNVAPGSILTQQSLRRAAVVLRGALVDGLMVDGPLEIQVKVEVMENGAPGQIVRVRNVTTRKELRGKVFDEQTVRLVL